MVRGCYLDHMIKTSLRSNIIRTIINVCDRAISSLERNKQDCDIAIGNIKTGELKYKKLVNPSQLF